MGEEETKRLERMELRRESSERRELSTCWPTTWFTRINKHEARSENITDINVYAHVSDV